MTNRPHVRKIGNSWRVYINDRLWHSSRAHEHAIAHAHGIATYAHRIRFNRDLARIQNALTRMESP